MNKKLLLTSALVGSLAIAGSADAKTKVYGDLEQTYASSSRDLAANKETGDEGYGSEANIGMKASKDVDLGTLSYGIKFEGDGNNTFDADDSEWVSRCCRWHHRRCHRLNATRLLGASLQRM